MGGKISSLLVVAIDEKYFQTLQQIRSLRELLPKH